VEDKNDDFLFLTLLLFFRISVTGIMKPYIFKDENLFAFIPRNKELITKALASLKKSIVKNMNI
jgi:hypothetical protein